jgi:hypothetical protein
LVLREREKKEVSEGEEEEEEAKSNPISSACVSLHTRTEKGELSVSRNNTDTIIPNKGSFFFFFFFSFHNFTYFLFHHFEVSFVELLGFLWNWISSSSISSVADLI